MNIISLYGPMLENIGNEQSLFIHHKYSEEYIEFFKKILVIINRIVKCELTFTQKKILLLFLDNKRIYDIAQFLKVNNSTVHQNFNLLIKRISIKLMEDPEFLEIIKTSNDYFKQNMFEWIENIKEKYNIKYHKCPMCKKKFKIKLDLKKHIMGNDRSHKIYYEKQVKFIEKMLKKNGFSVKWIYENEDYLLCSISWIWNYWRQIKDAGKYKKTIFSVFKFKRKKRI